MGDAGGCYEFIGFFVEKLHDVFAVSRINIGKENAARCADNDVRVISEKPIRIIEDFVTGKNLLSRPARFKRLKCVVFEPQHVKTSLFSDKHLFRAGIKSELPHASGDCLDVR